MKGTNFEDVVINRDMLRWGVPWAIVVLFVVSAPFAYRHVYEQGKEYGELETMYDEMASRMPKDLRVLIALLTTDDHPLPHNDRLMFRGWLKGTLDFAEGMVIPGEEQRGHADRVADLKALLKRGRELDAALGPMYPENEAKREDENAVNAANE